MLQADGNLQRVLITGGTGTLGYALTKAFLARGFAVSILSRDAHKQVQFSQVFPQVKCYLGDIRDVTTVAKSMRGQDIVVHAAALKQVDKGQVHVAEFKSVNVDGTQVVAEVAEQMGVQRALFIGSDKQVSSINLYGMTKAVAEKLWLGSTEPGGTRFSAVRYGNVMGSNGSVIPIWQSQIARGEAITVRTPETTRFFMRKQDAVKLVIDALVYMQGGETFIPGDVPAFSLHDLAEQFEPDYTRWRLLPLGDGEKVHEVLVAPGEHVVMVRDGLYKIINRVAGKQTVDAQFCSSTARRISGKVLVETLQAERA